MRVEAPRGEIWGQVAARWSQLDPFQRHVFRLAALGFALALLFAMGALYFAVRSAESTERIPARPAIGGEARE